MEWRWDVERLYEQWTWGKRETEWSKGRCLSLKCGHFTSLYLWNTLLFPNIFHIKLICYYKCLYYVSVVDSQSIAPTKIFFFEIQPHISGCKIFLPTYHTNFWNSTITTELICLSLYFYLLSLFPVLFSWYHHSPNFWPLNLGTIFYLFLFLDSSSYVIRKILSELTFCNLNYCYTCPFFSLQSLSLLI